MAADRDAAKGQVASLIERFFDSRDDKYLMDALALLAEDDDDAAYGREEVNYDAALVLAALDLGLQAWRTTPSRTRFTEAVAALGRLRVAAENQRTGRIVHGDA